MRLIIVLSFILPNVCRAQMSMGGFWNNSASLQFLAGNYGGFGWVDLSGSAARFESLLSITFDNSGNIIVLDQTGIVRKVTPSGLVTTIAGSDAAPGFANGTGLQARFNYPVAIAQDPSGNYFVADSSNYIIRKVTPNGAVSTFAGKKGVSGNLDGSGTLAKFFGPVGVTVDSLGNIYVVDTGSTIRKITSSGVVTTFAGRSYAVGIADGSGTYARFAYPTGIAADSSNNIYVADSANETIRKITPTGIVTTVAGLALIEGSTDGTGTTALFNYPAAIAVDSMGNIYVADEGNSTVRRIDTGGVVTTIAGVAGVLDYIDGVGTAARFYNPKGIGIDSSGQIYLADTGNETLRKITPGGVVTTVAGAPLVSGSVDGMGSGARFLNPRGIGADLSGNLYIADSINSVIRKVTPAGSVTTLAGKAGISGTIDGSGTDAVFMAPTGIAVDFTGNVYVSDVNDNTIRKITPSGIVTTLAGAPGNSGASDGSGTMALFSYMWGIALDNSGNIYVSDTGNNTIRKSTPSGVVTTIAGSAGVAGFANGSGASAQFNNPEGITVDNAGNVFVVDSGNYVIRKIDPSGMVTTLVGSAGVYGTKDGSGTAAKFSNGPTGITIDSVGNLYVADTQSSTVRKITPSGVVTTVLGNVRQGVALGNLPAQPGSVQYLVIAQNHLYLVSGNAILYTSKLP